MKAENGFHVSGYSKYWLLKNHTYSSLKSFLF